MSVRILNEMVDNFSRDSDKWFDEISLGKISPEMIDIARDIKSEKLKPTERGYEKFKNRLNKIRSSVPKSLFNFIDNIDAGKYNDEFRYMYGNFLYGGKSSQVTELFSFFEQAVLYYEYAGIKK